MSIKRIPLRKLIRLIYASDRLRTRILRADIRVSEKKAGGVAGTGGDFFGPFWTDAKDHVAGIVDLRTETVNRIAANHRRARLYPLLMEGFLRLWNEKRRWRNEPIEVVPGSAHGWLHDAGLEASVRVDNVLVAKVRGQFNRVVYPYFFEAPTLSGEGARLGLWAMHVALGQYAPEELRIVDILRSTSFSIRNHPFHGDEERIFFDRYKNVLNEYDKLIDEYKK